MARIYVFGDEAGDIVFSRKQGASKYFVVGTATMPDCEIGTDLTELRRELAWGGHMLAEFHAHKDKQVVRNLVFDLIENADIRIDATIMDKAKTQDHLRANPFQFYKEAWFLHFKYVLPHVASPGDELLVVASALQINRKKKAIHKALDDVVNQVSPTFHCKTAFLPAVSDPCLQLADYGLWAIQRKWERADTRSYDRISQKIRSEFDVFRMSETTYY